MTRPCRSDTWSSRTLINANEALKQLEVVDPELAERVEMHYYFGGDTDTDTDTDSEIAELQGVTEPTVRCRQHKACAWLFMALGPT